MPITLNSRASEINVKLCFVCVCVCVYMYVLIYLYMCVHAHGGQKPQGEREMKCLKGLALADGLGWSPVNPKPLRGSHVGGRDG